VRDESLHGTSRAVASPIQPEGREVLGGAKYLSFFKFEVKNRHKSAEEAKT